MPCNFVPYKFFFKGIHFVCIHWLCVWRSEDNLSFPPTMWVLGVHQG